MNLAVTGRCDRKELKKMSREGFRIFLAAVSNDFRKGGGGEKNGPRSETIKRRVHT